jgi:hypothetical protein
LVDLFRLAVGADLSVHQVVDVVEPHAPEVFASTLAEVRRRVALGQRFGDALDAFDELGEPVRPLVASLRAAAFDGVALGPALERVAADARLQRRRWAEINARLLHNWAAGVHGGRPKGTKKETQGKPKGSPIETDRVDRVEKIEKREGIERCAQHAFSSISEIVKAIKTCRPELKRLNEMSVENIVKDCPEHLRAKTFAEFVSSVADMLTCPNDPIGLLRGYVKKATESIGTGEHHGTDNRTRPATNETRRRNPDGEYPEPVRPPPLI